MSPRPDVLGDRSIRGQDTLGVAGGLARWQPPWPVGGRLVRVPRPMVQIGVLPVLQSRQDGLVGCTRAAELIRDDDPRDVSSPVEPRAATLLGCSRVAPT